MTHYAATLLLAILLPIAGYSQQSKAVTKKSNLSTVKPAKVATSETISNDKIEHVSSNQLSSTITVHTYKLLNVSTPIQTDGDLQNTTSNTTEVDSIIASFLSIEGVSRCTFDKATQTFTILSTPETDLSLTVNSINQ